MIIKICGITDTDTLVQSCALDIGLVGFVHHPGSVRHVDILFLSKLMEQIPEPIQSVLVMVDPADSKLDYVFEWCHPDYIQLHGSETPERVMEIKKKYRSKVIKAIPVAYAEDVAKAAAYDQAADMILFDTKVEKGISGGSGKTFDWELLSDYQSARPWMLSGGLSAENVGEAMRVTKAPMVDASSHLENPIKSGCKSIEKIQAFVNAVKA